MGSLVSPNDFYNKYLNGASVFMNENQSVVYFTAKLSAIVFILMVIVTRLKREIFSRLNDWQTG